MEDQRYKDENRRVICNMKEEKLKLQEFKGRNNGFTQSVMNDNKSQNDDTSNTEESIYSSCGHKACRNMLLSVESSTGEPSLEGRQRISDTQLNFFTSKYRRSSKSEEYSSDFSDDVHERGLIAQFSSTSQLKVGSTCNSTESLSDLIHHRAVPLVGLKLPTALTCALAALFEVKAFHCFIKDQRNLKICGMQSQTSEDYVLKMISKIVGQLSQSKGANNGILFEFVKDIADHLTAKDSPGLLEELFQILHKSLVEKRKGDPQDKICLLGCRQKGRVNHSIISHLFRGFIKSKAKCSCGAVIVDHQTFSILDLPHAEIEWRSVAVSHFNVKEGQLTRYLFQVNQWTMGGSLTARVAKNIGQNVKDLVLAAVRDNCIIAINENEAAILDAEKLGGTLWTFERIRVQPRLKKISMDTMVSTEDEYPFTSTPADSDIADPEGKCGPMQSRDTQKRNGLLAVNIFSIGQRPKEDAINIPLVCKLMSPISVQDVLQSIESTLGINVDWNTSKIYIKDMKVMLCLICQGTKCSGCQLSQHYLITGSKDCCLYIDFYVPHSHISEISISNDISYSFGVPCKSLLLEEKIRAFLKRTEKRKCSRCGFHTHHQIETRILKHPEVLAMRIHQGRQSKIPLIINSTVSLNVGRIVSKKHILRLVAVVANENGERVLLVKKKGIGLWMKVSRADGAVACSSPPDFGVELALYSSVNKTKSSKFKKAPRKIAHLPSIKGEKHNLIKSKSREATTAEDYAQACDKMPLETHSEELNVDVRFHDGVSSSCTCSSCQRIDNMLQKVPSSQENVTPSSSADIRNHVVNENFWYEDASSSDMTHQLHHAILQQNIREAMRCLNAGANADALIDGVAAMHLAAGMAAPKGYMFTRLLMDYGCDLNIETDEGYTPLTIATMWQRKETVNLLLTHGEEIHQCNNSVPGVHNKDPCSGKMISKGAIGVDEDTNSNTLFFDITNSSRHVVGNHPSISFSQPTAALTTVAEESLEEVEYSPQSFIKAKRPRKVICCRSRLIHRLGKRFRRSIAFLFCARTDSLRIET